MENKPKRSTWSFEPDDDVARLLAQAFPNGITHGGKRRLMNTVLRWRIFAAAVNLAEQDLVIKAKEIEQIKAEIAKLKKLSRHGAASKAGSADTILAILKKEGARGRQVPPK